jgi:hypothetical protein
MRRWWQWRGTTVLLIGVLVSLGLTAPSGAAQAGTAPAGTAPAAAAPPCVTTPSQTQPGYSVADPACDFTGSQYTGGRFEPLTHAAGQQVSRVFSGIADGAAYRVEVPTDWNGELVLYAHGYRGQGTTVWVDTTYLRQYYISHGFAWAASSYQTNGYDVGHGVTDTHALLGLFRSLVRQPRHVYMTGASMGGHVAAVEIEKYRDFVGAMPICGALGDKELFDFQLDANVTAAALTGTPISFPATLAAGQAYAPTYDAQVLSELPALGSGFTGRNPAAVTLTPLGQQWAATVEQRSGGSRPGFGSAFAYWNSFGFAPLTNIPFLFGLYPGLSGGTIAIAAGNVTSNIGTVYRFSGGHGPLSPAELALNAAVLRVAATTPPSPDLTGVPKVFGDPRIPVLSMHDVGDLFVPFSMEQIYAAEVARHHQSRLFVSRAIRGVGHCDFTEAELERGFADLVGWVRQHHRAAGDDVRNAGAVARPTFGCRFTDPTPGSHPAFVDVPCP